MWNGVIIRESETGTLSLPFQIPNCRVNEGDGFGIMTPIGPIPVPADQPTS